MKRVLLISSEFPPGPGGIGTHAHQLASGLAGLGWEPLVLTSQDYVADSEIARFNAAQPFPVVRFRRVPFAPAEALYRGAVLSRWIRRSEPNAVIASGSRSVWLAASRLRGGAMPWLAVGHGSEFGAGGWEGYAVRWAFGQATEVVCVSEFTREWMRRSGVSPRRESVIHNGADDRQFRRLAADDAKAARAELGIRSGRLLVTVGNVTERKGQDIVVKALPRILGEAPDTHYLVVGLPSRGDELQALARRLGVAERVHLLGRTEPERLVRLLNAADLFVMTSRPTAHGDVEGYGIAAVEAALCGLPAVVASGSGLAEAVRDRETALLVPPDDPEATAGAVLRLWRDPALLRAMGERARVRAISEQTWTRVAANYDERLREICGGSLESPADAAMAVRGSAS